MFLALFILFYWTISFLVLATVFVFWVGMWILAFAVAIIIEIVRALAQRRRPKKPSARVPPPQARWSDRR